MLIEQAISEFETWIDADYDNKNIPSKEALLKAYAGLRVFEGMTDSWKTNILNGEI